MQTSGKLIKNSVKVITGICLSFFTTVPASAQAATPQRMENSLLFNPYFYLMLFIIFIFSMIILVLGKVLVAVAKINLTRSKEAGMITSIILLFGISLMPSIAQAQSPTPSLFADSYFGLPVDVFFMLLTVILIEVIIVFTLLRSLSRVFKVQLPTVQETQKTKDSWFFRKFVAGAPLEEEESIMTDHEYDGIRELDNGMPPWLQYMFVATFAFAVIYLFDYHVLKSSPLQLAEYNKELADAEVQMKEYRKNAADNIDETNAALVMDDASLKEGLNIYKTNCTACHGQLGEGGVGPNFTDDYWIHGGDIKDMFRIIKYGVVEKGMKSWQAEMAPTQIQQVASYIKSLQGTNPPNQKEKQGDLYIEKLLADTTMKDTKSVQLTDSIELSVNK